MLTMADRLAQTFLCRDLEPAERDRLAEIAVERRARAGQILFVQGQPAPSFYVLLEGCVRIYKVSPEGREYTLHRIEPGQMFAEAAVFRSDGYPANAEAVEDSRVASFDRGRFAALLADSPQISLKIIVALSAFVRELNQQVEDLSLRDVPARLAAFLLRAADAAGGDSIELDVTKAELARSLGTISETLSRNLGRMRDRGLVRVERTRITLLDTPALQGIADGEKL